MRQKLPAIITILFLLLLVPALGHARTVVQASTTNDSWERAVTLGTNPSTAVLYGRLGDTGDARFYSFSATRASTLTVQVEIAEEATGLEPRVVLYIPEEITIGPALPMSQPPKTLAAVYPANASKVHVEGPLRTTLTTRVDQSVELPKPGRYYLAVYNAGRASGAYRLSVVSDPASDWPISIRLRSWWLANVWLGPQYGALTIPLLIGVAALAAWLIVRRVPSPARIRRPGRRPKRTVTRARVS